MDDAYEAVKVVMLRIRIFDPENASKIMEYMLLHCLPKDVMIHLSFCRKYLFENYMKQLKIKMRTIPNPNPPIPQDSPRINDRVIPYQAIGQDSARLPHYSAELQNLPCPGRYHSKAFCRQLLPGEYSELSKASRTIYVQFSYWMKLRDKDFYKYFSKFGCVEDVRIPNNSFPKNQRFGFVIFVHPETVEKVLAITGPHVVNCCSVLVKHYTDPESELQLQYQQAELDSNLPGYNSRAQFDPNIRPVTSKESMIQSYLGDQADLRLATTLQSIRMMNLRLTTSMEDQNVSLPSSSYSPQLPLKTWVNDQHFTLGASKFNLPEVSEGAHPVVGDNPAEEGFEFLSHNDTNPDNQQQHRNEEDSYIIPTRREFFDEHSDNASI